MFKKKNKKKLHMNGNIYHSTQYIIGPTEVNRWVKYLYSSWRCFIKRTLWLCRDLPAPKALHGVRCLAFLKWAWQISEFYLEGNVPKRTKLLKKLLHMNSYQFILIMIWLVWGLKEVCVLLLWLLLFLDFLVVKFQMSPTSDSRNEHLLPS